MPVQVHTLELRGAVRAQISLLVERAIRRLADGELLRVLIDLPPTEAAEVATFSPSRDDSRCVAPIAERSWSLVVRRGT